MKILNVIETASGMFTSVESWPFDTYIEGGDADVEEYTEAAAEKDFIAKARANGFDGDEEEILQHGSWSCSNGYEVSLVWSDKINKI